MLQAIQQSTGRLTLASQAARDLTYRCPECGEDLVWRHGPAVVDHFAHHPGSQCRLGAGESGEHLRGKEQLYHWAQAHAWQPQLEVYLPEINQRPDLLVTINGQLSAIEFQCSPLSLSKIMERNAGYRQLGIPVHWLLGSPYHHRLTRAKCAQFTQLSHGEPQLLYWDTRAHKLVKRNARRLSYLSHPPASRSQIAVRQTRKIQQELNHRNPGLRLLTMAAYRQHHLLAGCPVVAHDWRAAWPVTTRPLLDWRISCLLWLEQVPLGYSWAKLQWEQCLLSHGQWLQFPCLADNGRGLIQGVISNFTADLVEAGLMKLVAEKVTLCRYPRWFPSAETKIGYLQRRRGGGCWQASNL